LNSDPQNDFTDEERRRSDIPALYALHIGRAAVFSVKVLLV
jgi:hypothetical protein